MADEPMSGAMSYAIYGYETTYATQASTITAPFGHELKISTLSKKNNMETLWGLGSNTASKIVAKHYEGAFTADFVLGKGYWLKSITGTTRTTTGAGPYVHYYVDTANENGGGAITLANTVSPFTVQNAHNQDTDLRNFLLGCTVNSTTLSASVGELVRVSMECNYANETTDSTLGSNILDTYADPFAFQYGTLELPTSTTIARVQSVELSWNRNVEQIRGLGSRFATKAPAKQFEASAKVNLTFENDDMLDLFYGAATAPSTTSVAETATMRLFFSNGGATTALRSLDLQFAGIQLDELGLPQDVKEITKQDITMPIRQWTLAKYTDNTAGGSVPGGA